MLIFLHQQRTYYPLINLPLKLNTTIQVLYQLVPVGSIGCFTSAEGGKIILSEDIPARHHDVVLLGLYSDYLQYAHSRVIDELRTCEVKVAYLNQISNTRLANLYEGQCDSLFKGKLLVLR